MITARRLVQADAEAFRALRLEALQGHPTAFGSSFEEARAQSVMDYARKIESRYGIGAFDGKRLVGLCFLDNDGQPKSGHRGWITAVYVTPQARRKGAAAQMLAHAVQAALSHDLLQLELFVAADNPTAQAFYEKHGFSRTGVSPRALIVNGVAVDEILMVRFLDA